MFKKIKNVVAIMTMMGVSHTAMSGVVDSADVVIGGNTYQTFTDDTTGLVWLDLDNFWGPTDTTNTVISDLSGSSFQLATESDLLDLQASIGVVSSGAAWTAMSTIVGGNYIGNADHGADRELIWGVFDDENGGNASYSWQYGTGGWQLQYDVISPNQVLETVNNTNKDLGAWVVGTVSVPAPSGIVLLGFGLLGLWRRARH